MLRLRFLLPPVKSGEEGRPTSCPYCRRDTFQRHGVAPKPIKDLRLPQVQVIRYLCTGCRRTFRHYPQGVDRHDQSKRTRALCALLWGLGLSLEAVSQVVSSLGCPLARMTVWRDVQELGQVIRLRPRPPGSISILGVDETVVKLKGGKVTVGFVTDPGNGELVGLDILAGQDSQAFFLWLKGYARKLGVRALLTDDLSTYKPVVEELGVEHQVCLAHVRKNLARRLKGIEGWEKEKAQLAALIKELPEGGGKSLLALEKQVREDPRLRQLVVELSEKWRSLVCYRRLPRMPSTNNRTEQVIGRSKIRYKLLRGFKSVQGLLNGLWLTQWVWTPDKLRDLGALMASA